MVKFIMDGWPFVAAIISPFVVWLNSYFGILQNESRDRLAAASSRDLVAPAGIISSLATKIFNRK